MLFYLLFLRFLFFVGFELRSPLFILFASLGRLSLFRLTCVEVWNFSINLFRGWKLSAADVWFVQWRGKRRSRGHVFWVDRYWSLFLTWIRHKSWCLNWHLIQIALSYLVLLTPWSKVNFFRLVLDKLRWLLHFIEASLERLHTHNIVLGVILVLLLQILRCQLSVAWPKWLLIIVLKWILTELHLITLERRLINV